MSTNEPSSSSTQPAQPRSVSIWLRCETKLFEARSALTPKTAATLIANGFSVVVERDPQRIFEDIEFEKAGCTLVPHSSWPEAPRDTLIIGLKELPEGDSPLPHTHIQFAHCYKQQGGWADVLARFRKPTPPGTLYDLEFLTDESGRRVAAFGYHAGFTGSAVGLLALATQVTSGGKDRLGPLEPYANETALINKVKEEIAAAQIELGRPVRALVIGALGRCGRGAVDMLKAAGLQDDSILKWDMAETAKGGPFSEILDVDLFVNCIYLNSKIPHFVTKETIEAAGSTRKLAVVVDVSCDTTNPNNPIPIYSINTTFDKPTVDVPLSASAPLLTVCSIDHLPTLLPREASEAFSADLLPSLLQLPDRHSARVWTEAQKLYESKAQEAQAHLAQQK